MAREKWRGKLNRAEANIQSISSQLAENAAQVTANTTLFEQTRDAMVAGGTESANAAVLLSSAGSYTNLPDRLINIAKLQIAGKNLFNPTTINTDKYLGSVTGGLISSAGWVTSDYISVTGGANISVNKCRFVAQYNSSKVMVAGTFLDVSPEAQRTVALNASTAYIRVSTATVNTSALQIEVGASSTAYEPFYEDFYHEGTKAVLKDSETVAARTSTTKSKQFDSLDARFEESESDSASLKLAQKDTLVKYQYGTNLFNAAVASTGKILSTTTGNLNTDANYTTSDYIPVSPSSPHNINKSRYIWEYDVNKSIVSGTLVDNSGLGNVTITTNAKTHYIRVSFANIQVATAQVEAGSSATPVVPFSATLKQSNGGPVYVDYATNHPVDIRISGKNRYDPATVLEDKILAASGNITTQSGWKTSEYIEVSASTQYAANSPRYIAEYTAAKVFVTGTFLDTSAQTPQTFTTNAATKYVRCTMISANSKYFQLEEGAAPTSFEPIKYSLYLNGRKMFDLSNTGGDDMGADLLQHGDYTKFVDRERYQIWRRNDTNATEIKAIWRDVAIKYASGTIYISTTGINGTYDTTVAFNSTNFPGLISGSTVSHIIICPFTRNMTTAQFGNDWRMNVITNKGQIYHNYPSRAVGTDGAAVAGDIAKFDESVIWDLPNRKLPSTDPGATGVEIYYPGLASDSYERHPALNGDNGFGHGGFDKSITINSVTYPRFWRPRLAAAQNSFTYFGGFEPGDKLSVIGTYNLNSAADEGCRICVFASSDGGRQWFNKYEFANIMSAGSGGNWANDISTSGLAADYTANSFVMSKVTLNVPSESDKEPATLFVHGSQIVISNISRASEAVVTTAAPHDLITGNIIVIKDNTGGGLTSPAWDWMRNESASTTSGGSGIFFKVEVINTTSFKLHDMIHNPHSNVPARHIHGINRIKDGYIISTGEQYPEGGYILHGYVQGADEFFLELGSSTIPFTRLNSTNGSLQRLIGGILLQDGTFIGAVDNEFCEMEPLALPSGRTETVSKNSAGIYKGLLSDIDDADKYECIFESKEVAYFFKEKGGALLFIGQLGQVAISFDQGSTWEVENIPDTLIHFGGESKKFIVIDKYVFVLK